MDREKQSLVEMGAFEEADLPAGAKSIGLKWVYTFKMDASGVNIPRKEKARLVAQGFIQLVSMTRLMHLRTSLPVTWLSFLYSSTYHAVFLSCHLPFLTLRKYMYLLTIIVSCLTFSLACLPVLYPKPHIPSGSERILPNSNHSYQIPTKFLPFRPNSYQIPTKYQPY